jgi:hypothetical protein
MTRKASRPAPALAGREPRGVDLDRIDSVATAKESSGQRANGLLRKILEAACATEGLAQKGLTVMSRADPYRLDTPTHHRNGQWAAKLLARFYGAIRKAHWRGLHYAIIMAKVKVKKPDSQIYRNTEEDWQWLSERACKAARWLGYISFDRIVDQRNAEPVIHRRPKVHPHAFLSVGLEVEIADADDIEPLPVAVGFDARQAFSFVFFGEKSSLEEILLPIAEQFRADLYLGPGEISDTFLWQIARDAVEDGRPLVLFALTDCDPSGWQMVISIGRKLQALCDLHFPGLRWELVHVGLTPDQVRELGLPEEPIKRGDKRAAAWEQAFGVKQTEIDALTTPEMQRRGVLDQIVMEAIRPYVDPTLERRVSEASEKWYEAARNAIDAQIDSQMLAEIRDEAAAKLEEAREALESVKSKLQLIAETHFDLPQIEVPEPKVDLNHGRQAVIRFDTDWTAATKILIARKKYIDGDEAEAESAE